MNRSKHSFAEFFTFAFLLYVAASFSAPTASAQFAIATGTPPFGSFGGGPDVVNLGNNNSHITIPVLHKAGRGQNFAMDIAYDSSVWFPVTAGGHTIWNPISSGGNITWGWSGIYNNSMGYITFQEIFIYAPCNPPFDMSQNEMSIYTNYAFVDQSGSAHNFNGAAPGSVAPRGGCTSLTPPTLPLNSAANDGSGYTLIVSTSGTSVYANNGQEVNVPLNPAGPPQNWSQVDRNGNVINGTSSGLYYDTLGYQVLTQNLVYTAPSGGTAQFVGKYTSLPVQTAFGCSGISELGPTSYSLLTEIDLPDYNANTNPNSRYTFTYEPTPGHSGYVTGRLASVTLPTGGRITYAYSGGSNGIICSDGTTATLTRTTPDGTWIYARSQISGNHWQTTITDPANNQTVIDFQKESGTGQYGVPPSYNFFETQRRSYQGTTSGTLLQTINTCYNSASSPCTGTSVASPITQKSVVTILPGSANLQSKTTASYDSHGNVTEVDEYDFGSGAPPSTPLRKTVTAYASLTNNINNMPSSVTLEDGSSNVKAKTTYAYDETSVTTTSGTPQHNSVSGSRGNVTTLKTYTGASSYLTKTMTYFDTGNVKTATDVNSGVTTYTYSSASASCGNSFPTGVTEAITTLTRSMTWNCTGGVQLTAVDENTQTTTTAYTDAYFWRPASVTDPTNAVTNTSYNGPTSVESALSINSNSVVDTLRTLDGLGRPMLQQTRQAPSSPNFDSVETAYNSVGRLYWTCLPYSGTAGQTNTSCPSVNNLYDALGRTTSTAYVPGGGSVTFSYSQNDVLVTVGPAPTGETTKRRQLEFDGLGRLTSVCEITNATGSGTCGQNTSQTGFWTKYSYDLNNNLVSVTQNAQAASGSQQTRSYSFDFLSRLTSETNPENGTTTYAYDSASGCTGTYNGDRVKKTDAAGNVTCTAYDLLHRPTTITYPSGPNSSTTAMKVFYYDTSHFNTTYNTKGRLASAGTCQNPTCAGPWITAEDFSYSARGEVTDVYEWTTNSGGWYHVTQSYWPHGAPSQLSNLAGLPTISYGGTIGSTVGLDGEGRITQVTASSGQNPVTGASYNTASLPTQVNFGSGDNDIFAYDSNTLRMTQFKFNVGTQSKYLNGALTWNANSSLNQLAITDQYNSSDTQTCNYTHDDLARIAAANCGTAANQTFSYDAFGNISKSGSPYSFQPTYTTSPPTNRFATIPGTTPSYDSNGNVTSDGSHTYAWDSDGNPITVDSVSLTFDALDRMVEQNRSGAYTQIVYGPGGGKLALMSGQTLQRAFIPLAGQATAVYTSSGLDHYRHSDWLGSARLTSSPTQSTGFLSSLAYAPFGETYASSGTTDVSFTGMNPDTVSSDYDFLHRPYTTQGRWPTPDPSGLSAVDPSNPQSWNRYAYVANNPLALIDPLGEDYCPLNGAGGCAYQMDGVYVSGAYLNSQLLAGTAAQCPNNDCSLVSKLTYDNDGNLVFIESPLFRVQQSSGIVILQMLGSGFTIPANDSYPNDGSMMSQIMNDPTLASNWTSTFTDAYNGVKTATAIEGGLTGVAFAAPAAVTAATTAYGWYYGATATGIVALGSQADTELAAVEDGVSRLWVTPEKFNFLNNLGQWWTFNKAFLDAHTFFGGRFMYVTDPNLVWSGSWYLNEVRYLTGH